jgi:cytochrome c-type biogenesis protein CcmH
MSSAPPPPVQAAADAPPPAIEKAREEVSALAANLPKAAPPPSRGSNIVGNVLLFVAACIAFIAIMYVVNKDAPKEHNPMQGGPPPMKQAAPAQEQQQPAQQQQQASGGASTLIQGTVKIDPALKDSAPPTGSIFVILRMAGMPDRGPPVAVKKLDDPRFPVAFAIGPSDVMMQGMPFDGPFDIYVRFDADGNAMTKAPGDLSLSAPASQIKPGQTGVEVTLDKRL